MRQNTKKFVSPEFTVDFSMATKMMVVVGLNGAGLLERVMEGRLRACWTSTGLDSLCFSKTDIQASVEQIRAEKQWIRRRNIATRMGVKITVVTKWVNAGLIMPIAIHANVQYFSPEDVDRFVREYIFSDEAARILGVGLSRAQLWQWIKQGKIKPISGPGIDGNGHYLFMIET